MWEYQEWMCIHCGWILKFAIGRTDVYTWCDKCHEPLDKIREVTTSSRSSAGQSTAL